MINLLIGFLLWPISGFIYIIIWNAAIKLTKFHPMFLHHWYESIAGIIALTFGDIRFFVRSKEDKTF